jgi:hypothetical protein
MIDFILKKIRAGIKETHVEFHTTTDLFEGGTQGGFCYVSGIALGSPAGRVGADIA